jgi:uncharacterized protein YjlB
LAVVPAYVAHARIDASEDFLVIGAYAGGRSPNKMRNDPGALATARQSITPLPLLEADPVNAATGRPTELSR